MTQDDNRYEGRNTGAGFGNTDRPDTSLTRSQTGHDTDGRSPDYDDGRDMTHRESLERGREAMAQSGGMIGGATDASIGVQASGATGNAGSTGGMTSGAAAGSSNATSRDGLGNNVDGMGRDRTDAVTADETGKLIAADKVIGTAVYNGRGDRLGTIDSIMIHKISGRVAYAVLSAGGFLGIGERYHPLPWSVLTYDEDKGGYNVDKSEDQLRGAPHFSRDELNHLDYGKASPQIHQHYGTSDDAYDLGRSAGGSAAYGTSTQGTTNPSGM
jgi:hypothetical protein